MRERSEVRDLTVELLPAQDGFLPVEDDFEPRHEVLCTRMKFTVSKARRNDGEHGGGALDMLTADDVEIDAEVILHDRQAVTDHGTAGGDADDRLGDREPGSPLGRQAHVRDQRLCLVRAALSHQSQTSEDMQNDHKHGFVCLFVCS